MDKYIDAEKLKYEIERRKLSNYYTDTDDYEAELFEIIDSLQQEQPEVELEKFISDFIDKKDSENQGKWCEEDIIEAMKSSFALGLNARKEK